MSEAEIAQKMLDDNGIADVKIISVPGQLTDHYNPGDKTVNLSEAVYSERTAAAAAVAVHEVGRAIQHATAYLWIGMRSSLVPMVGSASKQSQWVIMGGLALAASSFSGKYVLLAGIIMCGTKLFDFVTLPVQYHASNRALAWLESPKMLNSNKHAGAKDALKWAARTYVVASLWSLVTLLYFLSIFLNRK